MPLYPFLSPFPLLPSLSFTASHFFTNSPHLLNKSLSHWRVLVSVSPALFSCCWHLYLPVYISFLPFICQLLSPPASFSLLPLPLNLSMSLYDIVMNWQFLFSLAANSINKMPSRQLSFPITAPHSVRMRLVSPLGEGFSLCWLLNWNGLAARAIRPAHHRQKKKRETI